MPVTKSTRTQEVRNKANMMLSTTHVTRRAGVNHYKMSCSFHTYKHESILINLKCKPRVTIFSVVANTNNRCLKRQLCLLNLLYWRGEIKMIKRCLAPCMHSAPFHTIQNLPVQIKSKSFSKQSQVTLRQLVHITPALTRRHHDNLIELNNDS